MSTRYLTRIQVILRRWTKIRWMWAVTIDADAEAQRPDHKCQAQEWAGIKQDPDADLFVFVGRWSKQKGVDLIADIVPSSYAFFIFQFFVLTHL